MCNLDGQGHEANTPDGHELKEVTLFKRSNGTKENKRKQKYDERL